VFLDIFYEVKKSYRPEKNRKYTKLCTEDDRDDLLKEEENANYNENKIQ